MGFDIRVAAASGDFLALQPLIARMADWDAGKTRDAGFPPETARDAYYGESAAALEEKLSAPGAAMLLACEDGAVLGCLGFTRFATDVGELEKFYVDPLARGRGIGRSLIDALLPMMATAGYGRACLETALFMTDALALYHRAGFRPCPPFRAPPPGLEGLSVFLDRPL